MTLWTQSICHQPNFFLRVEIRPNRAELRRPESPCRIRSMSQYQRQPELASWSLAAQREVTRSVRSRTARVRRVFIWMEHRRTRIHQHNLIEENSISAVSRSRGVWFRRNKVGNPLACRRVSLSGNRATSQPRNLPPLPLRARLLGVKMPVTPCDTRLS